MSSTRLVVGFIPLLDCASIVAAAECGFAAAEGIDLRLVRDSSWANIRDRLIVGQFDAAHMLAPMCIASSLGIGHLRVSMSAPVALGLGGNAITVSSALHAAMTRAGLPAGLDAVAAGAALHTVLRSRAVAPVFAMVYPFSSHNYQLRCWLAGSGIDPDRDVRLIVLPPPLLADALREGQIDGFCAGEPWSSVAVAAGAGAIIASTGQVCPRSPEKVLALRSDWMQGHAPLVAGLVRAVVRAALWCERRANHAELARLLSGPRYVGVPAPLLQSALCGELRLQPGAPAVTVQDFLQLARGAASFPWPGHALWLYRQMVRWGQIRPCAAAAATALGTYRPDVYRDAVAGLPLDIPRMNLRSEPLPGGSCLHGSSPHDGGANPGGARHDGSA